MARKTLSNKSVVPEKPIWKKIEFWAIIISVITSFTIYFFQNKQKQSEPYFNKTSNNETVSQTNPKNSPVTVNGENQHNDNSKTYNEVVPKPVDNDPNLIIASANDNPVYVGKNRFLRSDSLRIIVNIQNMGHGDAYNLISELETFKLNPKSSHDKYYWIGQTTNRMFSKNFVFKMGESQLLDGDFRSIDLNDTVYIYYKLSYSNSKNKKMTPIEDVLQYNPGSLNINLPHANANAYDEILKYVKMYKKRYADHMKTKDSL